MIIGLYTGNMLVNAFPIILPNFRIVITYQEQPRESDFPIKICVTSPSGPDGDLTIFQADVPRESINAIPVPPGTENETQYISANFIAAFSPLMLMRAGRIRVRAYRGDDEIRLGTLRVVLRSDWEEEQRKLAEGLSQKEAAH